MQLSCNNDNGSSNMLTEAIAHHKAVKDALAKIKQADNSISDIVNESNIDLNNRYPAHHALSHETLAAVFTSIRQIGNRKFIEPNDLDYYEFTTLGWRSKRETFRGEWMDYYKRYIFYDGRNASTIKLIVEDVGYYPAWKIALEWNLLTEEKSDSAIYIPELYKDFAEAGLITRLVKPTKSLIWYVAEPDSNSVTKSWIYRTIFNNQLIFTAIPAHKMDESELAEFLDIAFDTETMKRIEALKPAQ